MAINEALVCQQPITELGVCKKGSTLTAKVEFQALRTGVHEVGKYMKLKLQYAVSSPSMPTSSGTLLSKSSVSMSSATPFLPTLKSPPSVKSSIQSSPPWVKYSPPPCSSQPKSSSPVTKVPLMQPHSHLSTSQSQSYDVPVVEQGMMGRPPLVRYLSQNQIKSLQAMKPRQRLSARSQSYGGEIIPEEEGQSLDVDRPSTSRKLSETTMGGSTLQRIRKSSYVDRIVKHPCQVFVVKTGQL